MKILVCSLALMGMLGCKAFHADNQMAVGEWKIELQTPPCDSAHNLQVIWPKESGAPMSVECDSMPVPAK